MIFIKINLLILVLFLTLSCNSDTLNKIERDAVQCHLEISKFANKISNSDTPQLYIIDSLLDMKENSNCLIRLKGASVEYLFPGGKYDGYLLYLENSKNIIFFTKSLYWLSARYTLKRKISDRLYIVEYFG